MRREIPNNSNKSRRVNDFTTALIQQMTLYEKVGQTVQVDCNWKGNIKKAIAAGGIGSVFTIKDTTLIQQYQQIAVNESKLRIPLLIGNDVIHGYKQTFPIPLALTSTWNPDLIKQIAHFSAQEAANHLTNWIFGPMVDISRDPRWGRIAEGCGEDVFLCSQISAAWVNGFQGVSPKLAACVKHFAGYGAVESGRDYNTVDLSERKLREVYFPPFKAALEAGVKTFMTSFTDVNGVPATINSFLINQVLRGEWGFDGVLVSDFDSIGELVHHGVATDLREAAKLSILASVDMDMMSDAYHYHLQDLVETGEVSIEVLDQAVRRILTLKVELGLFKEMNTRIFSSYRNEEQKMGDDLLLQAARESIILIKNQENLLPIKKNVKKIALIGPFAANQLDLLGSWNFDGNVGDVEVVADALRRQVDKSVQLNWSLGTDVFGKTDSIEQAVEIASGSDLIILAVGEPASFSGEAHSRTILDLPGKQMQLSEEILALDIPVVLVIFSGRPLCLPALYAKAPAVLYAWQGGKMAAQALAETLTGKNNPSAKLPISIPRTIGQIPIYYAQKRTGRPSYLEGTLQFNEAHKSIYIDESNEPAFPFGFGLSYSKFQLSHLELEKSLLPFTGKLEFNLEIQNAGEVAGKEIVQVYISDEVSSISQPIKELKAFMKVHLEPGETKNVKFSIPCQNLAIINREFTSEVEPGRFTLWVGISSMCTLSTTFTVG